MNAQTNFASILDMPTSEIERPKPLPTGTYTFSIQGLYKEDKSTKKQTPYIEFTCKPVAAGDDVDQDALKEMGGLGDKTFRHTFYLTENSAFRLKDFLLDDLKLEEQDNLRQMLADTPNCQFLGTIKHRPSEDGKAVFAEIGSTAPVE